MARLVGLTVALSLPAQTRSCTYVEVPYPGDADGVSYMIARTMELSDAFGHVTYDIETVPASVSGGKFGYVAPMSLLTIGEKSFKSAFEGMNEKGFTASALAFSESVYEAKGGGAENLPFLNVVERLLAHCDSVDSALDYLASVRVVPLLVPFNEGIHWALADSAGRSVVVEYLQGQRVVHENGEVRVMTNDPNMQWQWRNLNTYANLNPGYPHQNDFLGVETSVGRVPRTVGHGWNLFGLPGDLSPPSRFVRMFYLRGYAMQHSPPKNASDAITLGTGLLNNVFIPRGTVAPDPRSLGDRFEYTPYGVLKCAQDRTMLVRAYRNSQWRRIDLARLDFTQAQAWPLEDGTDGVLDITADGRPASGSGAEVFF